MKSILYPPTLDWDFMFQRPQQIMRQFARNGWKVIYCNKKQSRGTPLKEVEPNLFICSDLVSFVKEHSAVDVFYSTWAKCVDLVSVIPHKVTVYDRLDDFAEWEKYENLMINSADIVFNSSQILYDKSLKLHDNAYLVRNACDYTHFHNDNREPPYKDKFQKPVIGFVGALGNWVDKEMLNYIANKYTLLIVGVEFGNKAPKNAIFLGEKSYEDLPIFYKCMDIGLIPFVKNRVTNAANPIKMYEYLACGIPVIATETPETSLFPNHVNIINKYTDIDDIVSRIMSSEDETIKMDRLVIAKNNTWEKRFSIIEKEIMKLL